jgi:psp operon transcriptional activator
MALISQQPIGQSDRFHALMDRVSDVASLDRPVLIVGERGTGKALIASRLHFLSPRWEQVYISLNCAAHSEAELEAKLFGYVSYDSRPDEESVFITAGGGTLFLDHIEACSPRLQEKLLETLEQREVLASGAAEAEDFDVRLICATSVDLNARAQQGLFRPDLIDFVAFHVMPLPPLRARLDDIPPLVEHFGRKITASLGAERFPGFTAEATASLMSRAWPGNVRELKLTVERSVAQAFLADESLSAPIAALVHNPFAGIVIDAPQMTVASAPAVHIPEVQIAPDVAPKPHPPSTPPTTALPERVKIFERGLIDEALTLSQDHQGRAAEHLGLTYHQFRGLLRKHGLKK